MATVEQSTTRTLFPGPFKTLAAALVGAQLNSKAVEKEATNQHHRYKYASAEAIIEEARAALNAAGLATIMEKWEILPALNGNEFQRVKVYFKTVHADSDNTLAGEVEYHIVPQAGRPEDKATATALTYAEGYYLRGLLCLPRVDAESDVDQRDDSRYDPSKRRGQQGQQQNRGQQRQAAQRQQATGNGQQAQRPQSQQTQQPANGNSQANPPAANTQQQPVQKANGTASNPPAAAPAGSERYRWWAAKIVGAGDVGQLTGMSAAIAKDQKLDDAERKTLTEMAANESRRREEAQERAGDPPIGRP